jgi:hypothetical protein
MAPTLPGRIAASDVEPVGVVAVLEADVVALLLGVAEDGAEVRLQPWLACRGPHHDRPAGCQSIAHRLEERLEIEGCVGLVDQVSWAVVDVEQHHVVRRAGGLGDRGRDVGDHDPCPVVGQQPGAVGDGAVAHPLDQRRLDLDDVAVLDPTVAQHPVEGEAEPETADEHPTGLLDQAERRVGQRELGGVLGGVHHEDPVGPELQYGRAAGVRVSLAQDQLAVLGHAARDLDVLHQVTVGDPPSGARSLVRGSK